MSNDLTRAEQTDLQRVIRMRAKVARSEIESQKANVLADLEQQLAAEYPPDDPRWADITKQAEVAVREADSKIAEICEAMGIPKQFRPGMGITWRDRGANGFATRRAELRRAGEARADALAKEIKAAIDRAELDAATAVVRVGLTSETAQQLLDGIPRPADLMQSMALLELESSIKSKQDRRQIYPDWPLS